MTEVFFFVFSGVILLGLLGMIFTKKVVYAAFLLVVVMVALAGIFVLFKADYLAVVQILVYAGGIVILLAFGLMLTQQIREGATPAAHHLLFPGLLVAVTVAFAFSVTIYQGSQLPLKYHTGSWPNQPVRTIGQLFMTEYLLAFELIAYLLLVVLVGASYYAKQSSRSVTQ
jgi:NADH:ubiquinone oxidoreductase subunit 6 (subunit J)